MIKKVLLKEVFEFIKKVNEKVKKVLLFENMKDFEDVKKGFIGIWDYVKVDMEDGYVVWDLDDYKFIEGEVFDFVNLSLWCIV